MVNSLENVARKVVEGGFKGGTLNMKPTSFPRKVKLKNETEDEI